MAAGCLRLLPAVLLLAAAATAAPHDAARLLVLAAEDELRAVEVRGSAAGVAGESGVKVSHAFTLHLVSESREFLSKGAAAGRGARTSGSLRPLPVAAYGRAMAVRAPSATIR